MQMYEHTVPKQMLEKALRTGAPAEQEAGDPLPELALNFQTTLSCGIRPLHRLSEALAQ